ncbi:MAG TPA: flagellar basal body P-ring protein FlgI [Pirellulaceae bacterium]|nr:flagellar basal body P-ring protein FlgI [Pirellulaceae bacterium]
MQSPDPESLIDEEVEKRVKLVGDLTGTWGVNYLKVESVALVTGLANTGSDPPPTPQRQALLAEMQSHEVHTPNQVLASPETSMVIVRGYLPPGCQKGDTFDVEVRVPPRSETTSLRGGWLMQTRMRENEFMGATVKTGHVIGLAQGAVIVDSVFQNNGDPVLETRGRVLSGATVTKARPMGLVVKSDFKTVRVSAAVGSAVNNRFHTFDHGVKTGVAEPKADNYIELTIHPRYKHNISRFIRVVRAIAVNENATDRSQRLLLLERMLQDPSTAATAATQLEAIGKDGIKLLSMGLKAQDPEVRFYSAESLAYLDQAECSAALKDAAMLEPAFRWHAITALSAMDHVSAYAALNELLHVQSAETRYGAFRALRTRNAHDPLVKGEVFHREFSLHVVPSPGEKMVHFTQSSRPEVVLFGDQIELLPVDFIFAGKQVVVKRLGEQELRISRFEPGKEDQIATCSTRLDDAIRTVAKLGGHYSDVLQLVHEAKKLNYITARVMVDALPSSSRLMEKQLEDTVAQDAANRRRVASPLPEMFTNRLARDASQDPDEADASIAAAAEAEREAEEAKESKKPGPLGRMMPWNWGR